MGGGGVLADAREVAVEAVSLALHGDKAAAVAAIEEFGDPVVLSLALVDVAVLCHQRWALEAGLDRVGMVSEWQAVCADIRAWREFGVPRPPR